MKRKRALITGISGQDGYYLAELLQSREYEVHGLVRPSSAGNARSTVTEADVQLHQVSLGDMDRISQLLREIAPDECYHLAAQTFVRAEDETETIRTNINGTHTLLASLSRTVPGCRFFYACSREIFGDATESPQRETTPFRPRSVYGITKLTGFELTRHYRESRGMHASSAILFNHESPRRGRQFVTRKITSGLAEILAGRASVVRLGRLDSRRDWGHARDFAQAMWLMLQQQAPDDYVLATGETHSVGEWAELACSLCGLSMAACIEEDPRLGGPSETSVARGDASKARRNLGWTPTVPFEQLVQEMVEEDCRLAGVDLSSRVSSREESSASRSAN